MPKLRHRVGVLGVNGSLNTGSHGESGRGQVHVESQQRRSFQLQNINSSSFPPTRADKHGVEAEYDPFTFLLGALTFHRSQNAPGLFVPEIRETQRDVRTTRTTGRTSLTDVCLSQ
ncbi:hypothetical protein DPEC_G00293970 [Dallia pectoralis]|uniref:Uncharacterized protein n=1 Tax=Dallia pectoralis TaxID=75939 RepID=A0ACC2FID8_DALPE|nr:hypothetical protein DPEC_G00293970 [Dallia pectoralis]